MEQVLGELKALQAQIMEFQQLEDLVIALLTRMESPILKLEQVEPNSEDQEQVEEKDKEPSTR